LNGWNVGQQTVTPDIQVGGTPDALAVSADGHYLLVGNHDALTQNGVASNLITRVDTGTGAVTQLLDPQSDAHTRGMRFLAVTADGTAIYSPQSYLTGSNGFRGVQPSAASPAFSSVAGLAAQDPFSWMLTSEDHRYILFGGSDQGNGPLTLYDSTIGRISATSDPLAFSSGGAFTPGKGDVSSAGGLAVDVTFGNVYVVDLGLHLVKTLDVPGFGSTVGATFSADGHQLFVWEGQAKTILVFDTATWKQEATLSANVATPMAITGSTFGQMDVVSQGKVLVLDNGSGFELIDLSQRLHADLSGDAGDQRIYGTIGGDSLSGLAGADTLVGGGGVDRLSGGTGADVFVINPGDSPAVDGQTDRIVDWEKADFISFGGPSGTAGNFLKLEAGGFAGALSAANQRIASGAADYVAVQVGDDVIVFADSRGDNGVADDAVYLPGRTLADIDFGNIGTAVAPQLNEPSLPAPPILSGFSASGSIVGNSDAGHLSHLIGAAINTATSTHLSLQGTGGIGLELSGIGLTYDANEQLTGGTVTDIAFNDVTAGGQGLLIGLHVPSISAAPFDGWVLTDADQTALQTILAGSDSLVGGSVVSDLIRGYDGNDQIYGMGGGDTIFGGTGNDVIYATQPITFFPVNSTASTYLRGEEGDDYIIGAQGFDDANGNQGNDTISTGAGDDFSVGGKDNDLLFGDDGNDIVWGNLGNDTCDGGNGNDQVRGGQGDDLVFGGAGDDFVSGDRGNDTVVGGAGADIFHTSQDAGIDRVLDFHRAEGDRVQVDPGTTYTLSQVGSDTVIDLGNGNQMILVGVQMSTLTPGWIFGA